MPTIVFIHGLSPHSTSWPPRQEFFSPVGWVATQKQYRHCDAATELVDFPDRGHSLTIDGGWREAADTSLTSHKGKGL